jgi:hypothetical protein
MRPLLALPLLVLALAACGGEDDEPAPQPQPQPAASSGIAAGPGLSIEEAIASDLDGALLVNGSLLARDGEVRLCSALAESFPPQCGGASLVVVGVDLDEVDGLTRGGGAAWTARPIQLLGDVEDGTITVSTTALG